MTKFSVSGESFHYELPQRTMVDLGIVEMVAKAEYNRGFDAGYDLANKEQQKIWKYCEQDVKAVEDLVADKVLFVTEDVSAKALERLKNKYKLWQRKQPKEETNYDKYFGSPEKVVTTLTKIGKSYSAMRDIMTCCMCTQKHEFCIGTTECQENREAWMRKKATDEPLL